MPASRASVFQRVIVIAFLAVGSVASPCAPALAQTDPMPSWNEGPAKKSITDLVSRVTPQGGADFVPAEQRIATFDNDGTLWCEQPAYFQLAFAFDRAKAMAPQHPEWKTTQPFKALVGIPKGGKRTDFHFTPKRFMVPRCLVIGKVG